MIKDYKVLMAYNESDLKKKIMDHLSAGWILQGGIGLDGQLHEQLDDQLDWRLYRQLNWQLNGQLGRQLRDKYYEG